MDEILKIVAYCPKDIGHEEFSATAHVAQEWKMDRAGDWVETLDDDVETIHSPDTEDVWTCLSCGARAEFTDSKTLEEMLKNEEGGNGYIHESESQTRK